MSGHLPRWPRSPTGSSRQHALQKPCPDNGWLLASSASSKLGLTKTRETMIKASEIATAIIVGLPLGVLTIHVFVNALEWLIVN